MHLNGLEVVDGHIMVNRQMETNLKGVDAAGDCTGKPYQYAKAVGEGLVAALSAAAIALCLSGIALFHLRPRPCFGALPIACAAAPPHA